MRNSFNRVGRWMAWGTLGVALLVAGCKPAGSDAAGGSAAKPGAPGKQGAGPPVMQVVAAVAQIQPVHETLSLVGSFTANEQIEVKSDSEGFVESIMFSEGQDVAKGDLLLT